MKHDLDVDMLNDLPDAPLAMPKQQLEHRGPSRLVEFVAALCGIFVRA